jgi:hypothetical protein
MVMLGLGPGAVVPVVVADVVVVPPWPVVVDLVVVVVVVPPVQAASNEHASSTVTKSAMILIRLCILNPPSFRLGFFAADPAAGYLNPLRQLNQNGWRKGFILIA